LERASSERGQKSLELRRVSNFVERELGTKTVFAGEAVSPEGIGGFCFPFRLGCFAPAANYLPVVVRKCLSGNELRFFVGCKNGCERGVAASILGSWAGKMNYHRRLAAYRFWVATPPPSLPGFDPMWTWLSRRFVSGPVNEFAPLFWVVAIWTVLGFGLSRSRAQGPTDLARLVHPEVAERLGLSDKQRGEIQTLLQQLTEARLNPDAAAAAAKGKEIESKIEQALTPEQLQQWKTTPPSGDLEFRFRDVYLLRQPPLFVGAGGRFAQQRVDDPRVHVDPSGEAIDVDASQQHDPDRVDPGGDARIAPFAGPVRVGAGQVPARDEAGRSRR
jgi:hypothetical protein